jgi:hypothetical protein
MDAAFFSLGCGGVADIDPPHPSPLPQGGEGEREPISVPFKSPVQLEISDRGLFIT